MPNILKSMVFGVKKKILALRENRNEEVVLLGAIDRILSNTKTKIPLIPNYRKHLKEPVCLALKKIDTMTAHIPGPVEIGPDSWGKSPLLRAVFPTPGDCRDWMDHCPILQDALKQGGEPVFYALLAAAYKEKTFTGVGRVGEFVQKDVLQRSILFEDPRLVLIHTDLQAARKELRHRILVVLFTRELREIADLKALQAELERQKDILTAKMVAGKKQNVPWRIDEKTAKEALALIHAIDGKIDKIGRDPDSPNSHLQHVTEVLTDIDRHLSMNPFTIRVNNLGIRVDAGATEPNDLLSFAECTYAGEHKRSVTWVKISRSLFSVSETG